MGYKLPNGDVVQEGEPFSIGTGKNKIQYPWNWLTHASAEDLAAHKITVVEDPVPAPVVPTMEELISAFTGIVQMRLDTFAQNKGYDSMLSAVSYANSTVPKFATEGQYCLQARDATWAACLQILQDVQDGNRLMPTEEQALSELPVLQWPA